MASEVDTIPPGSARELNLAIARPLFAYLEKNHGREALRRLADETALPEETLLNPQRWVTLEHFEAVLKTTRDIVGTDDAFMAACSFDMVKSYGPLALVFRAGTVLLSYRILAATVHFASTISAYRIPRSTRNSVTLEYRGKKPESRLMCLSRQAQLPTVPLMFWNLPPAQLKEEKCIARGDDCCEYHIRWSEHLRWHWPFIGTVVGTLASLAARPLHIQYAMLTFALVGGLIGAAVAFRRMLQQAQAFHTDTTTRVGELVKEHNEAVEQIMGLHSRQEAFNALMAERIEARTSTLQTMLTEISSTRARSEVAMRGLSHDMNNPLQVVKINAQVLSEEANEDVAEMGRQISQSVDRVEAQLKRLLDIASTEEKAFALNNEQVRVSSIVDRIRKNLQALVIARDIRVSVFRTRETPETVETDLMLFERVIDNLTSNAVKYTDRGSIIVEVSGSPGQLVFKISDTGRGIGAERLEKVFIGGSRDSAPLLGESHGIGLSNTIRLLDELGGRLEVMSKPDVGTTIWAYLPVVAPKHEKTEMRSADASEVLRRVVTIRSAANQ